MGMGTGAAGSTQMRKLGERLTEDTALQRLVDNAEQRVEETSNAPPPDPKQLMRNLRVDPV